MRRPFLQGPPQESSKASILLTFDVEDWYQVENLRPFYPHEVWDRCEDRVADSTRRLLDLLDRAASEHSEGIRGTFFVLGTVAERHPDLVREIHLRGHEVASHGYWHRLCLEDRPERIEEDLRNSRRLLEDILGIRVEGYRAPGFSVSDQILRWVRDAGYRYDSSYNTFAWNPRHGEVALNGRRFGIAWEWEPGFHELPVSNLHLGKAVLPWAGGGYFRLIPLRLFVRGVERIIRKQRGYVFYAHPWEFDPDQPRVRGLKALARFRHYWNLRGTADGLRNFIRSFSDCCFLSCREYLKFLESSQCAMRI